MSAERPKVVCRLRLEFSSGEAAEKIHRSVQLDNDGYLDSRVEGSAILAEIKAESLKSLMHTLEDFLACTSVAEKMLAKGPIRENPSP